MVVDRSMKLHLMEMIFLLLVVFYMDMERIEIGVVVEPLDVCVNVRMEVCLFHLFFVRYCLF